MASRPTAVIINQHLMNDTAVAKLSQLSFLKLILSQNTPSSSIIFPSLKCSFLLLDISPDDPPESVLETCHKFIDSSTNAVIVVRSTMMFRSLANFANMLTIKLSRDLSSVTVIPTTHNNVADTIIYFASKWSQEKDEEGDEDSNDEKTGDEMREELAEIFCEAGGINELDAAVLASETSSLSQLEDCLSEFPHYMTSWLYKDKPIW